MPTENLPPFQPDTGLTFEDTADQSGKPAVLVHQDGQPIGVLDEAADAEHWVFIPLKR